MNQEQFVDAVLMLKRGNDNEIGVLNIGKEMCYGHIGLAMICTSLKNLIQVRFNDFPKLIS